jgi:hypothetical protein
MTADPYTAASDTLLYLSALGLLTCAWIFVRFASRRTARAAARSIHPSVRVAAPCHMCRRHPGTKTRTLRSTYTAHRVCEGCDHEGTAKNRWIETQKVAS